MQEKFPVCRPVATVTQCCLGDQAKNMAHASGRTPCDERCQCRFMAYRMKGMKAGCFPGMALLPLREGYVAWLQAREVCSDGIGGERTAASQIEGQRLHAMKQSGEMACLAPPALGRSPAQVSGLGAGLSGVSARLVWDWLRRCRISLRRKPDQRGHGRRCAPLTVRGVRQWSFR